MSWKSFTQDFSEQMIKGFEEGCGMKRDNPRFSTLVVFAFLFYGFILSCICAALFKILSGK
jgi:hypothetical protein